MGNAIANSKYRWPNGRIPYEIDPHLLSNTDAATAVRQAVEHWNNNTIIQLVRRDDETDYLYFTLDLEVCNSFVGKKGGKQSILCALTSSAGFGMQSVVHEIGHAVGLFHEHTRLDRNNYVTINFDNVPNEYHDNFDYPKDENGNPIPTIDFGEYDFSSVMHYSANAFAIDTSIDTITCRTGPCPTTMGSRLLSPTDIRTVEGIYSLDFESLGGQNWTKRLMAMTALGNALYVIENETLYHVDPNTGTWTARTGPVWEKRPIAMTALGNALYVIENKTLYHVDPNTGVWTARTGPVWTNSPIAMTALGNALYIIENETLYHVDPNTGAWTARTGPVWTNSPIAMTALGNALYVIENETLYHVDPNTGTWTTRTGPVWTNSPIAMTALGNALYVIENETLYHVDPNTGVWVARGGKMWKKPPYAISGIASHLYLIDNGHLFKIKT
ncbi:M12 family metallopeptidase [Bacillus mycoides]|uniref:M12 family metallopeptidase n=1 Tax=Bacillus mycoides TaxID=1405 RepID=UPI001F13FE0F|nr:M12 family metallopeptidase [Bacillus mycoides]